MKSMQVMDVRGLLNGAKNNHRPQKFSWPRLNRRPVMEVSLKHFVVTLSCIETRYRLQN